MYEVLCLYYTGLMFHPNLTMLSERIRDTEQFFFSLKFSQMKWNFFIIEYRSNQAMLFLALLTTCDALRDKTRYLKVGNNFGLQQSMLKVPDYFPCLEYLVLQSQILSKQNSWPIKTLTLHHVCSILMWIGYVLVSAPRDTFVIILISCSQKYFGTIFT